MSAKTAGWSRLDNAAKIFPPTTSREDTKVFRFGCELFEQVQPDLLQKALDRAIGEFPLYRCVLHRGMFWYYLEQTNLPVRVVEESRPPCGPLYDRNRKDLLFEVSYFRERINLEIYHSLSDATGTLQFLKTIVVYYLSLSHPDQFPEPPILDYGASLSEKMDDSFSKYYQRSKGGKAFGTSRAYRVRGSKIPDYRLKVTEGVLSAKAALKIAHEYGGTLTELLAGVLTMALYDEMTVRDRKLPVVLTVPVNLRRFFSSETARNFFGVINIQYDFSKEPADLRQVIKRMREQFQQKLTAESLAKRMNGLSGIEHNPFARVTPLACKDVALWFANLMDERGITAALSNVGRVDMPEAVRAYIRQFNVMAATKRVQLCVCSYGDNLSLTFTTPFAGTNVQKVFFRTLSGMGLDLEISTNLPDEKEE